MATGAMSYTGSMKDVYSPAKPTAAIMAIKPELTLSADAAPVNSGGKTPVPDGDPKPPDPEARTVVVAAVNCVSDFLSLSKLVE